MSPQGKFTLETMTDVQEAFMVMMTPQRVANLVEAADLIADLSPEAKEWLRRADKEKIAELEATLKFWNNTNVIWRFLWIGGGTIVAAVVGIAQAWDWLSKLFIVKFK